MAGPNVLQLYTDDVAFETLVSLMAAMDEGTRAMPTDLMYHIELVQLIADCTEVRVVVGLALRGGPSLTTPANTASGCEGRCLRPGPGQELVYADQGTELDRAGGDCARHRASQGPGGGQACVLPPAEPRLRAIGRTCVRGRQARAKETWTHTDGKTGALALPVGTPRAHR